jgi:hypothetical protein
MPPAPAQPTHIHLVQAGEEGQPPVISTGAPIIADAVAIAQPTIFGTRPLPGQLQRELATAPDVRRGVAA